MTGKCENPFVNHLVEFCRIACDVHYMHSLRKVKKKQQQVYYSRRDYGRAYNERTTETTILSLHTVK